VSPTASIKNFPLDDAVQPVSTQSEDRVVEPASARHPENFRIFLIDSRLVSGLSKFIVFTLIIFFTVLSNFAF
jgi:hypothetical protein